MFRLGVSPCPRRNVAAAVESTVQPHRPVSKLHDPGVGALVGARVGVVLSSLQHMMPPALPTEI